MADATPKEIYAALNTANLQYSAISWNGFNLIGDRKSIEEVRRLMSMESRANALQRALDQK